MSAQRLLVVGAGQLGSALAVDAARAGYRVTVAVRRQPAADLQAQGCAVVVGWPAATFDLAVVCVPDRAVVAVAGQANAAAVRTAVWLHTAGALPGDLLRDVVPQGCSVGNLHPLAAVSGPAINSPLRGALFALAGDALALRAARDLAVALGGLPAEVPDSARAAYHAAAALVANDWVALLSLGEHLVEQAGLDTAALRVGLLHLGRTALERIAQLPPEQPAIAGLTGAVRRGDAATVRAHLDVLRPLEGGTAVHARCSALLARELVATGTLPADLAAAVLAACQAEA